MEINGNGSRGKSQRSFCKSLKVTLKRLRIINVSVSYHRRKIYHTFLLGIIFSLFSSQFAYYVQWKPLLSSWAQPFNLMEEYCVSESVKLKFFQRNSWYIDLKASIVQSLIYSSESSFTHTQIEREDVRKELMGFLASVVCKVTCILTLEAYLLSPIINVDISLILKTIEKLYWLFISLHSHLNAMWITTNSKWSVEARFSKSTANVQEAWLLI